jgi:hypothetical protein
VGFTAGKDTGAREYKVIAKLFNSFLTANKSTCKADTLHSSNDWFD